MKQPQEVKIILAAVVILLILVAGYMWSPSYRSPGTDNSQITAPPVDDKSKIVTVMNTKTVNGALPVPKGFPQDIPLEQSTIADSATTHYPLENAEQLSVSYRSSKTVGQKYDEYKSYMSQAGYNLTEGAIGASERTIFGTKGNVSLSVTINSSGGNTLVQLSYVLK